MPAVLQTAPFGRSGNLPRAALPDGTVKDSTVKDSGTRCWRQHEEPRAPRGPASPHRPPTRNHRLPGRTHRPRLPGATGRAAREPPATDRPTTNATQLG